MSLQAASRTDRGVHASGQVVNFFTSKELDFGLLRCSCNRLLPSDIRILEIEKAADDFHPSTSSIGKTYTYDVMHGILNPLQRHAVWNYPYPLKLDLMQQATQRCLGKRDFAAFENTSASPASCTVCDLSVFNVTQIGHCFHFELFGNRFLYKMVRNLIGTVCTIGSGQLQLDALEAIFTSRLRQDAGRCAPAHALVLKSVDYAV